jgi:serine/threonine-protein kinase HipA
MSRKAKVFVDNHQAGVLEELVYKKQYRFSYLEGYKGHPVSLTMPLHQKVYNYEGFPPFFDGLLPEGIMLDALLKKRKIDRDDNMSQLMIVGHDMVGNVTVEEIV